MRCPLCRELCWNGDDARGSWRQPQGLWLPNHTVVTGGGGGGVVVVVVQRPPLPTSPPHSRGAHLALVGLCFPHSTAASPFLLPSILPSTQAACFISPPCSRSQGGGRRHAKVLIVLMEMANTQPFHLAAQKQRLLGMQLPTIGESKIFVRYSNKINIPNY